jgi:predicted MFS family arabinose efflux permease
MPFAVIWLAVATFASGMGSFVIAGLLPEIAIDFDVTVPTAGFLVTAFSVAFALAAPIMAAISAPLPPRSVLLLSTGAVAFVNLASALAPTYGLLMSARLLLGLTACLLFPGAAAMASGLVPAERRGQALAIVVAGVTVATALGVPFGTFIGHAFGWRMSFLAVAVATAAAWVGVFFGVPAVPNPPSVSLRERLAPLRQTAVCAALLTTAASVAGLHTLYTYIAPYLAALEISGNYLPIALSLFGIGGFAGSLLGGWAADRFGTSRVLAGTIIGAAIFAAGFSIVPAMSAAGPIAFALILPWAIVGWAFIPPRQSRLIALAPVSATIVLALNQSAIHVGAAMGSVAGALTLIHAAPAALGVAAASLSIVALAALVAEQKARQIGDAFRRLPTNWLNLQPVLPGENRPTSTRVQSFPLLAQHRDA